MCNVITPPGVNPVAVKYIILQLTSSVRGSGGDEVTVWSRQRYSRRTVSNLREICESTVRYCHSLNAVLVQLKNCHLVIILRLSSKLYSGVCYNERGYNEQFLSIKSGCYNEHRCYNERCYTGMLQRTVFINIIRMLQRTVFINKRGCYNEHRCYNERCYNERMLQRTVFISKIRMPQWTMLQRTNATMNSFYQ